MKKMLICFIIIFVIIIFGINLIVVLSTNKKIISEDTAKEKSDIDCILILGAGIWGEKPSPMLEDRLNEGIALYKKGVSSKIIMSGDHGKEEHDEVNIMKNYAIEKGVPSIISIFVPTFYNFMFYLSFVIFPSPLTGITSPK